MISLSNIKKKYPKFCFRDIHPNNINYYWNKNDALEAYNNKLLEINKEKYKKLNFQQKLEKINEFDNRIPIINFDLYYP